MRCIAYTRPDGGVSIIRPAPWHRLCAAITIGDKREEFDPPVHFDRLVVQHKTDYLSPEWAETEDELVARVMARSVPPDAANVTLTEHGDLPPDREFRDAWKHTGSRVEVDMPAAREIHKNRLREMRQPLLAALDIAYQRADEIGDTIAKSAVALRKQKLRDVTADPAIATAKTPEALAQVIPDCLEPPGA